MNNKVQNSTLLSVAIIASLGALQAAEKDTKPNFILINIDDFGWADVGYNSQYTESDFFETPNIDRLNAMGVSFHNGYASAANSAPSRACMFSGQYTPRHGVYTVGSGGKGNLMPPKNNNHLPSGTTTLPMALRDGGYKTCHIGKWHIGGSDQIEGQGIDLNIGGNSSGYPKKVKGGGAHSSPQGNVQLLEHYDKAEITGVCLTKLLGDAAVTYIDTVDLTKPFFMSYAPYAVHAPLDAILYPDLLSKYNEKAGGSAKYAVMVEVMDRTIGTIVAALEKRGIAENTVIVFTSDNGGTNSQFPLRAVKGCFNEGGIREPFIVYQKGKIEGGRYITDVSVGQIDLFPTFIEMAGISYTDLLDGESLVPILTSGDKKTLEERYMYWHFPGYLSGKGSIAAGKRASPLSVVRYKQWKLIQHYDLLLLDKSGKPIPEFEFYNIDDDISETKNLAISTMTANEKSSFDNLRIKLDAWRDATDASIPPAKKAK